MRLVTVFTNQKDIFNTLNNALKENVKVELVESNLNLGETIISKKPQVVFIDIDFLKDEKKNTKISEEIKNLKAQIGNIPIVIMAPKERVSEGLKAVKAGARTHLSYPIKPAELKHVLDTVFTSLIGDTKPENGFFWKITLAHLVRTNSPLMQKVFEDIKRVAQTDATVLITGETGTGKNILAKLIHEHSHRFDKPFIPVHCGAIPENLIESEFFGHEKGAFTGAVRRKLGKFEIANGGTIFLDEIGTITPAVQIKLLQVLQEGVFYRVGGEHTIQTDVRIIAATNVDLKILAEQGVFRQDLYYRLNVFPIYVPPLRERKEDLPILVETILEKLNRRHRKNITTIDPEVMEAFEHYNWPGNIRELENVMERAYILETSDRLTPRNFPLDIMNSVRKDKVCIMDTIRLITPSENKMTISQFRKYVVEQAEKAYISRVLKIHGGKIKVSADYAGITPRQLRKLMKKYGINKENFKSQTNNNQNFTQA